MRVISCPDRTFSRSPTVSRRLPIRPGCASSRFCGSWSCRSASLRRCSARASRACRATSEDPGRRRACSSGARKAAGCSSRSPSRRGPSRCSRCSTPGPTSRPGPVRSRTQRGSRRSAPSAPRRRTAISPATPRSGTRSARSTSPKAKSRRRSTARSGDRPVGRLVDIGTGTGRMIELFGPRAEPGDRHRPLARKCCASPASSSRRPGIAVELRQGDMYALPLADGARRHGDPPPGAALRARSRPRRSPRRRGVLGAGGRLLIVDFAPHEREELRATRRAHPPRLRRRGDGGLVRGGRARRRDRSSISKGGELTVTLWLARAPRAACAAAEGGMNSRFEPMKRDARHRAAVRGSCAGDIAGQLRILPAEDREDGGDLVGVDPDARAAAARASSRSPTAPAARPASAPTRPSSGSSRETALAAAAHLTCVEASRDEIDAIARDYWDARRAPHRRAARRSAGAGRAVRAASRRLCAMPPSWSRA